MPRSVSTAQLSILAVLMVVTGAVGAITGGNSLVNVPLMMLVGMAPRTAVATNMFAVTFMTVSATARFARGGLIKWRLFAPLAAITLATSALGAFVAVKLPERTVKLVVGVSMVALVVFVLLQRGRTTTPAPPSPARRAAGYVASAALGVYGGFFSGGYATLMTVLCTLTFGLTMMESVAVTKPVNLVSCAAASVVFLAGGLVDLRVGLVLAAANLVGGWLGARSALEHGERFVRVLFLATVGLLAGKLLLWDVVFGWLRDR
jgi:uncharacterized protein